MNAASLAIVGPGHGPGGSPRAITISPVLTGRDANLRRYRAGAPLLHVVDPAQGY